MAKQVELKCPLSTGYRGWEEGVCVCGSARVVGGGFKRHGRGVFVDYFSCWSLYTSSMRLRVINTITNMACFQIFLQFLVNMVAKKRSFARTRMSNQCKRKICSTLQFCNMWLKVHIGGDTVLESYHFTVPCWEATQADIEIGCQLPTGSLSLALGTIQ